MALRPALLGLILLAWCQVAAADLTIESGETFSLTDNETLIIEDNLTINAAGTFNGANPTEIRLSGNWMNKGAYNTNANTVYFTGFNTTSTISGDNLFYNFIVDHERIDTSNKKLKFDVGSTQSILNSLTINGRTNTSLISITSTTPGEQFNAFDIGQAQSVVVDFVDVQDAVALNGNVDALNSINSGNTLDWFGAGSLFVENFWPITDAIGVSFTEFCFSVLFTNPINPVAGKNLIIRDSTGAVVNTVAVDDISRVLIDESMVVFEPGVLLSPQEVYTVQLDAGAFELANSATSVIPLSTQVDWQFTTLEPASTDPRGLNFDNGIVARDKFTATLLDPNGDGDQSDSPVSGLIASIDTNNETLGFTDISGQVAGAIVSHQLDVHRDDARQEIYIDTSIPSDGVPDAMWDVDANVLEKVNLDIQQVISDTTSAADDVSNKTGLPKGDENAQEVDSAIPHLAGGTLDANHEFKLWGYNGGEFKAVTQTITSGVNGWEVTDADYILPLDLGDNMVVLRGSISLPLPIITPASIRLTKVANRKEISVGGIVTYTITAENLTTTTLVSVNVLDDIPPGFKYIKGSAHLDGVAVNPVGIGQGLLTYNMQSIDPGTSNIKTLRYQLVVGTGVNLGKYVNTAVAAAPGGGINAALSSPAKASVKVVPDALFDLSTIIGKVFHDRNGDGVQELGEEPIPFAKVVSATGKVITTDKNGQYHMAGVKEGRHAIRIDERSLPYGSKLVTRKVNIVNVSKGIPVKANFAVQLPHGQSAKQKILRIETINELKPILNVVALTDVYLLPGLDSQPDRELDSQPDSQLENQVSSNHHKQLLQQPITFYLFSNYGAFFERWKLELFEPRTKRIIKTITGTTSDFFKPVSWGGETDAPYSFKENSKLAYRLTVTDSNGRSDTTHMQLLTVHSESPNLANSQYKNQYKHQYTLPDNNWLKNLSDMDITHERHIAINGKAVQMFGHGFSHVRVSLNNKKIIDMPVYAVAKMSAEQLLANGSSMNKTQPPVTKLILPSDSIFIEALSTSKSMPAQHQANIKGALLKNVPKKYYAVQLLAERYLLDAQVLLYSNNVYGSSIVKINSNGENWYVALLGYYPDKKSANRAATSFSEKYPTFNPWVRSVAGLKKVALEQSDTISDWLNDETSTTIGGTEKSNKTRTRVLGKNAFVIDRQGINLAKKGETDLFLIALVDAQVGYRDISGNLETATAGDSQFKEKVWKDGKIALYLKGTIKGKYLITANYDSEREDEELFRQLNPDEIYPIYGDEAISQDLAADAYGKLYLLIQWDNSSAKWGKYSTALSNTELAHFERFLQGGKVNYKSVDTTIFGEPVTTAMAFDARAQQKSVQNEFLATGGSLYYLKHQDVISDSLQVNVEVRDLITGNVLATKNLVAVVDYQLDASAGRIIFAHPLDRYVDSGLLTTADLDSGNLVYVVTNYNYAIIDDYQKGISGGRVKQAITDSVSLGVTYANEDKEAGSYELSATDLTVHVNEKSKLTFEYAQTKSLGIDRHVSMDGGLNWAIDDAPSLAAQILAKDQTGSAWSIKGDASLMRERINMDYYYREVDDTFSANATRHQLGKKAAGFDVSGGLSNSTSLRYKHDSQWLMDSGSTEANFQLRGNQENHTDIIQLTHDLERLSLTTEYRSQRFSPLSTNLPGSIAMQDSGLLAAQVSYQLNKSIQLLAAQQLTTQGESNNQTSMGIRKQLTPNLNLGALGLFSENGEAFETDASFQLAKKLSTSATLRRGSLGDKSILGANYTPDENRSYRVAFEQVEKSINTLNGESDPARNDLVVGSTHRFGDGYTFGQDSSVTVAGEKERQANAVKLGKEMAGGRSVYGSLNVHEERSAQQNSNGEGAEVGGSLNYNWAAYLKGGRGYVNRLDGSRDRRFYSGFGIAYVRQDPADDKMLMKARFSIEQQSERGANDRDSQLIQVDARGRLNQDWSLMSGIDWGRTTDNTLGEVIARNNRFDLGFAYRPVFTDTVNLLGKYSWVNNEAPDNQSSITGLEADKGQVYAADILYELNQSWQLGSKLAYRFGEEKIIDLPWAKSNTWLMAVRGGYLFNADTKIMVEFRRLDQQQAQDSKDGYVFEFSKRFKDSIEAAIGYNYAGFNDDLGDMDYTVKGTYIRITGTFTE